MKLEKSGGVKRLAPYNPFPLYHRENACACLTAVALILPSQ